MAAARDVEVPCDRVEAGLAVKPLVNRREIFVAQAQVQVQLRRDAPVVLRKQRIGVAEIVDVVQVVDISTLGLAREQSRQSAAAGAWVAGIIGELSGECLSRREG